MAAPDPGQGSAYASAPNDFTYRKPFGGTIHAQNGYRMPFGPTLHGAAGSKAKQPPAAPATPQATANPYGSESGPGILESWFNQRATGTDPAYQYALKRGGDDIDNRMAAGGSFNSGARGQQLSDYTANMGAQRLGQLDALAGGASGEHAGRLTQMFGTGNAIASGESGINSAYDISAANAQSDALKAALGFGVNKAGVDSQANKQGMSNLIGLGSLFA